MQIAHLLLKLIKLALGHRQPALRSVIAANSLPFKGVLVFVSHLSLIWHLAVFPLASGRGLSINFDAPE